MVEPEEEYLRDRPFFELVEIGDLPASGSLQSASGEQSSRGRYATNMIGRAEEAWRTPFRDLSCEQVRLLLGQKMGLQWLGRACVRFVARYPSATVSFYPGHFSLPCLEAAGELARVAEPEFTEWLRGDFSWMDEVFGWDEELLARGNAALESARRQARLA